MVEENITLAMKSHNYFVYITTNPSRTVLYVGVTNDLVYRLEQHKENRGKPETFAGRYTATSYSTMNAIPMWSTPSIEKRS